jgi:hypothetical protein
MAAPAYLESNGRIAIPSRLRPEAGGTLAVVILPRPPLASATLANANQGQVASISWLDDDGTGHQEPLWLASAPPASSGVVEVDRYGGTFARARAAFNIDSGTHAFTFMRAGTAGPGGEVLADTAALRGMGGVVWYDHKGTLGHVKGTDGNDAPVDAVADMIDAHTLMGGTVDATTDPAHPALLLEVPAAERRRATLGDLVPALGGYIVTLVEVNPNEIDITGAEPIPAEPPPAGPHLLVTVEALRYALKVPNGSPNDENLLASCVAATDIVETYCGQVFADPAPAAVATAALQVASRVYRSGDVVFGVLNSDLGSQFTGRWITPEIEALLIGRRKTFGIG